MGARYNSSWLLFSAGAEQDYLAQRNDLTSSISAAAEERPQEGFSAAPSSVRPPSRSHRGSFEFPKLAYADPPSNEYGRGGCGGEDMAGGLEAASSSTSYYDVPHGAVAVEYHADLKIGTVSGCVGGR